MTTAIFPLSGNPFTFGHLNIVERASSIFDHVVVAIGNNVNKKYLLNQEERFLLAKKILKNFKNVEVVSFEGLLVDYAYENNIKLIVRGIRDNDHYAEEIINYSNGYKINNKIESVFLPNQPDFPETSSTLVRELIKNVIPCPDFLHPEVEKITFFKIHNKIVLNIDNYDEKILNNYIKLQTQKIKIIEIPENADKEISNIIVRRAIDSDYSLFFIVNKSKVTLPHFETITLTESINKNINEINDICNCFFSYIIKK
jgi:pantetheine-phosphate adenylyltransferase